MSVNVTYVMPDSETTLWSTRDDAVNFFDAFTVPSATLTVEGVVKKSASVSYTPFAAYDETGFFSLVLGGTTENVVQEATFEEVRTKLLTLSNTVNSLLVALRNAGTLNS